MFKAVDMVKLRIICPKSRIKSVVATLYDAKAIDIIEHKKDEIDIGTPTEGSEELSDSIVKARSVMYQLGIKADDGAEAADLTYLKTTQKLIDNLHSVVSASTRRKKEIEQRKKVLDANGYVLNAIKKMGLSTELFGESRLLNHYLGTVSDPIQLKKDLREQVKDNYDMAYSENGKPVAAIFASKEQETKVLNVLRNQNFKELKLDEEFSKKDSLANIKKELLKLENEEKNIQTDLKKIRRTRKSELVSIERALSIAVKKAEAPMMFAETKNISVISGWVPLADKDKVIKQLGKTTRNNIHVEELEIETKDSVPVKLDNPAYAKPYEFFLRLFSMPNYKEIDPTLFMFFTFPLFFGFMLGDMGYGLVTLFLFIILKMKMPGMKTLLNIMIFCSISSIIFGAVFGEAFGFELAEFMGEHDTAMADDAHAIETEGHAGDAYVDETHGTEEHHAAYPLIHRSADTALDLIVMSIIIGAIHVNLGLLLGFINIFRHHGLTHAVLEKGSWWLLQIAVALIALAGMNIMVPAMMWVGGALVLVAAVMLFKGEGVQGLVELPSIFVHMGSYMRLMAIGLASVGLAVVINEQTVPLFSKGIVGIIGGILIFTVGHTVNIALGVIGPFLHSLRLHYVEHFTKFYKGGGKEFSPFGAD